MGASQIFFPHKSDSFFLVKIRDFPLALTFPFFLPTTQSNRENSFYCVNEMKTINLNHTSTTIYILDIGIVLISMQHSPQDLCNDLEFVFFIIPWVTSKFYQYNI